MNPRRSLAIGVACICAFAVYAPAARAQGEHAGHGGGEVYGRVRFPTSCNPAVQVDFDRAVAMLHSFFYPETEKAFLRCPSGIRRARWPTGAWPSASDPTR